MNIADTVLLNGKIFTVDDEFTIVSAIAIGGGNILAVGTDEDIEAYIGAQTQVVDLFGDTVLPGINDSHLHGFAFGLDTPPLSLDLTYPAVKSIADVVEAVRDAVSGAEPGKWIVGTGWDEGYLAECVASADVRPTRYDLDAVSPQNPVMLQDFSRHVSWVNSAALKQAGVDESTEVPEGGLIPVGSDGALLGLLYEGAQELVQRALPPLNREVRTSAIKSAIGHMQSLGITSFTDPALGPGGEHLAGGALATEGLSVYADLARAGELGIRVSTLLLPTGMSSTAEEFETSLDSISAPEVTDPRTFQVLGVKIFADGIPPSKTAWMHEEYVTGGCGALCVAGESDERRVAEVTEMIRTAHRAGHQIGVHVTGDRAIDVVVDAFVAAQKETPREDARHYLIHGDFVSSESLEKLARHGFGVNMNPTIKWTIADLEIGVVGHERAAYEFPFRSAVEAGVKLMSSSDAPVTLPDWRQGLSTMLLRKSKASGEVSGPGQTIALAEAVRTYTINPAWQDFAESWKGSLEPGKVADLCVIEGDLETVDANLIPEMKVLLTYLDGEVIFDSSRDR